MGKIIYKSLLILSFIGLYAESYIRDIPPNESISALVFFSCVLLLPFALICEWDD